MSWGALPGAAALARRPSFRLPEIRVPWEPMLVDNGVEWCIMVHMPTNEKTVRQSVTFPARIAKRVRALARKRRLSQSKVIVDLIESGLEAKDREKRHYLELLERLRCAEDPAEQERLTEELARLTFGE